MPPNLQEDQSPPRATTGGPVCIQTNPPTPSVCQLETRSICQGNGCLHPQLGGVQGLRKPTLESNNQSTHPNQGSTGKTGPSGSSMESTTLVPNPTGYANTQTGPTTQQTRPDTTDSQSQLPRRDTTFSRVDYLRDRFRSQEISEEASTLLLASWRHKTAKSYDSLFGRWVSWCSERDTDPISGDIAEVVNFLAHLFQEGYQYRSLNAYRSAISSMHEKVDGYEVGQHPLVARLLKGAFHQRPPQPRYTATWEISKVTNYLESLGDNVHLSMQALTFKTANAHGTDTAVPGHWLN